MKWFLVNQSATVITERRIVMLQLKSEICRPVVEIVGRGVVDLPWYKSRHLAELALNHILSFKEVEVMWSTIVCTMSYLV